MAKTTKPAEKVRHETIIINGVVKKAYKGSTKYDDKEKNRITIFDEALDYTEITAYDNQPDKLTPSWYKDQEGYINLASGFEIPVLDLNGREITFKDWIDTCDVHNATVSVKIRQKDGSVYPVAIKVWADGEPVNPFEGM